MTIVNAICECCNRETLCMVEFHPEPISICESCLREEHDDRDEMADAFEEFNPDDYDDSMDGDFDSAMASAGMGTDEDYGYYGENDCYFPESDYGE